MNIPIFIVWKYFGIAILDIMLKKGESEETIGNYYF